MSFFFYGTWARMEIKWLRSHFQPSSQPTSHVLSTVLCSAGCVNVHACPMLFLRRMIITTNSLTGAGRHAPRMVWVTRAKGKSVECNGKKKKCQHPKGLDVGRWVSSKLTACNKKKPKKRRKNALCVQLCRNTMLWKIKDISCFMAASLLCDTYSTSKRKLLSHPLVRGLKVSWELSLIALDILFILWASLLNVCCQYKQWRLQIFITRGGR